MIQNPLRTPLRLHLPAFLVCAALSLLPLLPSRASALSLLAGFRLLLPAPLLCLALPARLLVFVLFCVCGSLLRWLVRLLAWPVPWFVWFVLCSLFACLWLVSRFRVCLLGLVALGLASLLAVLVSLLVFVCTFLFY